MINVEPHPHQLTPEECAADVERAPLNQAKAAAYEAYFAAGRALSLLDETVDPKLVKEARALHQKAWKLYDALVAETEW